MPQPLSKIRPNATVILWPPTTNHVLATLAAHIVALSAQVDHELSLLWIRILGTSERSALAMADVFDSQRQQLRLLRAATEAKLGADTEAYRVFSALLKSAETAQSDRQKLAHWLWGYCSELTDTLLVANPKLVRSRATEQAKLLEKREHMLAYILQTEPAVVEQETQAIAKLYAADPEAIWVYDIPDLQKSITDLGEALMALHYFRYYLSPMKPNALAEPNEELRDFQTSDGALRRLNSLRLFREAYARERGSTDQSSNPQSQP
jgi:hypothetical protein